MRRFEMREGGSSKFWEIDVSGKRFTVRFGRIGTDGQTKAKSAASPAAAANEAEKLIREKLGKGYVEIGGAKTAKPAKAPKAAPPKTQRAPRAPAATGEFTFTSELDALYERGYPHLRLLSDEAVSAAKSTQAAVRAIDAIDPYFPVTIPKETARRYLRGYVHEAFDAKTKEKLAKDDGPIDAAWLEEVLERKCAPTKTLSYGGETYDFRLEEIMFVFEAFLGTEVVAEAIVRHLARARDNPKWWGSSVDHDHQEAQRLVFVLGWMRLRMSGARWSKIVAPLKGSKSKQLPTYVAQLCALADDAVPSEHMELAMQRRDRKAAAGSFVARRKFCDDPQLIYVIGKDALLEVETKSLPRLAKWQQLRLIDEMGTIQAPGTLRVIGALLQSRSAGEAAAAWIQAHADFARASLSAIDGASASAIRGILTGKAEPAPAKVDKKALEREVRAIFQGIEATLKAQRGNPKKELDALKKAYARYGEIRAAMGEVIPEAYFTHHFADVTPKWKVDDATTTRWLDLAVEACD